MSLSTFLNGRDPVRLRGLLWLALSDTGVLERSTFTSDGGGGGTASWAAAGTFDCRVDPLSAGSGGVLGGRIDERSTHLVTCPPGAGVTTSDRFAIQGRGTFEVTAERQQTAEFASSFEVIQVS